VRGFQFQHHDGDDDGDDAVAEGFEAVFAHMMSTLTLAGKDCVIPVGIRILEPRTVGIVRKLL
jgi:hypothetical protein